MGAWKGEPAFILGGGPSIKAFDFGRLRGHGRVVAVNNAYTRFPDADVLFWADRRWFDWNHHDLGKHTGPLKITRKKPHLSHPYDIHVVRHVPGVALSRDPEAVAGFCGGASSINLAFLMGADPIVLLGFDMQGANWHDLHRLPTEPGKHAAKFIPALERMAPELAKEGVTVLNTNPDSALRCFPFADIDDLLKS